MSSGTYIFHVRLALLTIAEIGVIAAEKKDIEDF